MPFRCPGRLYAKSLFDGGDPRKDYEEFFIHPEILAFSEVLRAFDLDLRYGPVILVVNLRDDRNLVFRYSRCATGDQNGRRHVRQEVFLVDSGQCGAMLAGQFAATPHADSKTFSVVSGSEGGLNEILADKVCGFEIKAYARQQGDFELIIKRQVDQSPREDSVRPRISQAKKHEGDAMSKFLLALFACACLAGGWCCWMMNGEKRRLERELGQTKAELMSCRDQISELQRREGTLLDLERKVSGIREIISTLKKSVAEAESLMLNAEESSSFVQQGDARGATHGKGE